MGTTFERRTLHKKAARHIAGLLVLTLIATVTVWLMSNLLFAMMASGLLLGVTVIGGGLFEIVHQIGHRGASFKSRFLRQAAAGHIEHHRSPDDLSGVRMNAQMQEVVDFTHLLIFSASLPWWFAQLPEVSAFIIGVATGSYVWFMKEEDGHVLAHTPQHKLGAWEALQAFFFYSDFHEGHHDPEDVRREERAPLALYHYQLWTELVCGERFYAAIDRIFVFLEHQGVIRSA